MSVCDVDDALAVLSATRHRGAYSWTYDADCARVVPAGWARPEAMPAYTVWEARTLANELRRIGACGPGMRQR
jgi:hypothetical protein